MSHLDVLFEFTCYSNCKAQSSRTFVTPFLAEISAGKEEINEIIYFDSIPPTFERDRKLLRRIRGINLMRKGSSSVKSIIIAQDRSFN